MALGSGSGDTKVDTLAFHMVANRSTWGEPHRQNMCVVTSGLSGPPWEESGPDEKKRLVMTFISPGMWATCSEICSLETSWNKSSVSSQREREHVPLPVDVRYHDGIVQRHQDCGAWRKGEPQKGFEHCSHLHWLMWSCCFRGSHFPWSMSPSRCVPHPIGQASVKRQWEKLVNVTGVPMKGS